MSATVKQKNPGWLKDLTKRYREGGQVAIGFPAGTDATGLAYPDGTRVVDVAVINQFGADFVHPGGTRYVVSGGKAQFVSNDFVGPVHGVTKSHRIVIPRRDFMGPGGRAAAEKAKPIAEAAVKAINKGNVDINSVLNQMGAVGAAEISNAIITLSDPPNAPSTARKKKSSNPLVDTGLMAQSVTWIVR